MGSVSRKCFSKKAAAKTQYETKADTRYTQLGTLCKVCGKPIRGGKTLCGSCSNFINKKQREERIAGNDRRRR